MKRIQSPHSAVILFQLGGALNELDEEYSPVGNRDARYVLNVAGSWEQADEDRANMEWAREAWNDMKRFSTAVSGLFVLDARLHGGRILHYWQRARRTGKGMPPHYRRIQRPER